MSSNTEVSGGNTDPTQKRQRNWMFTNYDLVEYKHEAITYAIWQKEMCPKTEKIHFQGYLELKEGKSLKWLKEHIDKKAHWEPRMGSQQHTINYCSKTESRIEGPWIIGTPKSQGKRTDIEKIFKDIQAGLSDKDILIQSEGASAKFERHINYIRRTMIGNITEKPNVTWIWGDTGTGKSTYVRVHHKDIYKKSNGKWWDGYIGQDTILWDEFDFKLEREEFLSITDKWQHRVETKGGTVVLASKNIYFITNKDPSEYLADGAMRRRIDVIKHMAGEVVHSSPQDSLSLV